MSNFSILKDFAEAVKISAKPTTSPYDTQATVTRVEGNTAWVHIPGGVAETPVKLTIAAKAGDTVQVRVGGGRAWLTGNATAPPTDDKKADYAITEIKGTNLLVKAVKKIAETAKKIADNTNQYFWFTETGTDTGAHITEIPQDEFLADPDNGGGNLLARSNGIAVRNGLTELAQFGASGVYLGQDSSGQLEITENSIVGISDMNMETFRITSGEYTAQREVTESIDKSYTASSSVTDWYEFAFQPIDNTEVSFYFVITFDDDTTQTTSTKTYTYIDDPDYIEVWLKGETGTSYEYTYQGQVSEKTIYGTFTRSDSKNIVKIEAVMTATVNATQVISYSFGERSGDSGKYSFIAGNKLIASQANQTVLGKYNVEDTNGTYAFIVGNGTANAARSNAFTVDWDGHIVSADGFSSELVGLTVTRVENSYCDATSINRLKAWRKSGLLFLFGNLTITTSMPTGTSETHIATISDWDAVTPVYTSAPAIQGSGTIHVSLQSDGKLYIANLSGISAGAWHRFWITVPVAS